MGVLRHYDEEEYKDSNVNIIIHEKVQSVGELCFNYDSDIVSFVKAYQGTLISWKASSQIRIEHEQMGLGQELRLISLVDFAETIWVAKNNETASDFTLSAKKSTLKQLAHKTNECAFELDEKIYAKEREILLQLGLSLYPWNLYVLKNLGFMYEVYGATEASRTLYKSCFQLTGNVGCKLHSLVVSPPLFWNDAQTQEWYIQLVTALYSALRQSYRLGATSSLSSEDENEEYSTPIYEFRNVPHNAQYIGYSPWVIYELLGTLMQKSFPVLQQYHKGNEIPIIPFTNRSISNYDNKVIIKKKIRIGLVSEEYSNSSPGLCIQELMKKIVKTVHSVSLNETHTIENRFELFFFDRIDLQLVFAVEMRAIATSTILLEKWDLEKSANAVRLSNIDILLYLAIPTSTMTYLLAMMRLAPIQIQYGIGHPITSGIPTLDYSIVSKDMVLLNNKDFIRTKQDRFTAMQCSLRIQSCLRSPSILKSKNISNDWTDKCLSEMKGNAAVCFSRGPQSIEYTEQIVMFESLGYHLPSPQQMYKGDVMVQKALNYYSSRRPIPDNFDFNGISNLDLELSFHCNELEVQLSKWRISGYITAKQIGCIEYTSESDVTVHPKKHHIYSCMQSIRKMHPIFDIVFLDIIALDPTAKFFVLESFKSVIPRILKLSSNSSIIDHFIFVPRLDHVDYLLVLSLSSIFLNTFPFGAGITSSEALALCIPVLVLPSQTAVLNFAYAQVTKLGNDISSWFIAEDIKEYSIQAVKLVLGDRSLPSLAEIKNKVCDRSVNLFDEKQLEETLYDFTSFFALITEN